MPAINVKLCMTCMKRLITVNPYVDEYGDVIPMKGIKLRQVSPKFCDHHVGEHIQHSKVVLTAMRCNHCSKEFFIKVKKDQKPTCPSCGSLYMTKISYDELNKEKENRNGSNS